LVARCRANAAAIEAWVDASPWIGFLAEEPATRSRTSVCLKVVDPAFTALPVDAQAAAAKRLASLLESEKVAYDTGSYRDAPPGLRIWAGATVETADLKALFPWLDWAYAVVKSEIAAS
jgi:phosphoserine aminotransferase